MVPKASARSVLHQPTPTQVNQPDKGTLGGMHCGVSEPGNGILRYIAIFPWVST